MALANIDAAQAALAVHTNFMEKLFCLSKGKQGRQTGSASVIPRCWFFLPRGQNLADLRPSRRLVAQVKAQLHPSWNDWLPLQLKHSRAFQSQPYIGNVRNLVSSDFRLISWAWVTLHNMRTQWHWSKYDFERKEIFDVLLWLSICVTFAPCPLAHNWRHSKILTPHQNGILIRYSSIIYFLIRWRKKGHDMFLDPA